MALLECEPLHSALLLLIFESARTYSLQDTVLISPTRSSFPIYAWCLECLNAVKTLWLDLHHSSEISLLSDWSNNWEVQFLMPNRRFQFQGSITPSLLTQFSFSELSVSCMTVALPPIQIDAWRHTLGTKHLSPKYRCSKFTLPPQPWWMVKSESSPLPNKKLQGKLPASVADIALAFNGCLWREMPQCSDPVYERRK